MKHRGAFVAGQLDAPAVRADDLPHDVQAEVIAWPRPSARRIEKVVTKRIGNRLPGVGDGEQHFLVAVDDGDDDRYAGIAVLHRVGEQVPHDLEQTVAVPLAGNLVPAVELDGVAGIREGYFGDGLPADIGERTAFAPQLRLALARA